MLHDFQQTKWFSDKELARRQRKKWRLFYFGMLCGCVSIWYSHTMRIDNHQTASGVITTALPIPEASTIPMPDLTHHISAPAPIELSWQSLDITPGSSIGQLLQQEHIDTKTIQQINANSLAKRYFPKILPQQKLTIATDQQHQLQILKLTVGFSRYLILSRTEGNRFEAFIDEVPPVSNTTLQQGTIHHTLAADARAAGLNDKMIADLTSLFSWNIDFVHDIHPGDHFKVLSRTYTDEEQHTMQGPIIAAEFTTRGHKYRLLRFTDHFGKTDYYSFDGQSTKPAFLRFPLQFTHISSRFSMARYQPILHLVRPHTGVDLAAPRGTPIKASANGHISFIGQQNGYGNVIMIDHGQGYQTLYAHLDHFAEHFARGTTVRQGQLIGFVGQTGLATGPHLHYEVRLHHQFFDPLTVKLPMSPSIAKSDFAEFSQLRKKWFDVLDR